MSKDSWTPMHPSIHSPKSIKIPDEFPYVELFTFYTVGSKQCWTRAGHVSRIDWAIRVKRKHGLNPKGGLEPYKSAHHQSSIPQLRNNKILASLWSLRKDDVYQRTVLSIGLTKNKTKHYVVKKTPVVRKKTLYCSLGWLLVAKVKTDTVARNLMCTLSIVFPKQKATTVFVQLKVRNDFFTTNSQGYRAYKLQFFHVRLGSIINSNMIFYITRKSNLSGNLWLVHIFFSVK